MHLIRLSALVLSISTMSSVALARPAPLAQVDARAASAINCSALEKQDFTRLAEAPTTITAARVVAASGDNEEYCQVTGVVAPQVGFEIRLPTQSWNGRYFQTGCGGMCGFIGIDRYCADAQARGFAVAAQDMGHKGEPWQGEPWGAVPAQRQDFGRRSTHVVAVASKAIIEAYYGKRAARSYFRGCSTGGREGLSEAQFYPHDFDGIIAGDFAMPIRQGGIATAWDAQHLLDENDEDIFSQDDLILLHGAVMKACDALDGVVDGLLIDPRQCRFDPAALLCSGAKGPHCLSKRQVASAAALYGGPRNSKGERLTPGGRALGSELAWGGGEYGGGKSRITIAEGTLKNLAFANVRPDFGYRDVDWDRDLPAMEAQAALFDVMPPRTAPDLAAFEKAGGKLLLYHGWWDPGVPAVGTLDYYAQVWTRRGGLEKTRDWFRVFLVPGMFHCRGGDAPNEFDMLSAMVDWVEKGQAPHRIIATQRAEDKSVKRTLPLYAYPEHAQYRGTGDVNDAANWTSARPKAVHDDRVEWIWGPRS
jgi:feruloyl esterase